MTSLLDDIKFIAQDIHNKEDNISSFDFPE